MPRCFRPIGADLLDVGQRLLRRQTARDPGGPAVVGDEDVGVAALAGRRHQRLDRVMPVRRVGMAVEIAADVVELHEGGQPAGLRRLDLARVLAQLGRDPRQPHRGVDLLLGGAGDAPSAGLPEDAVLGDLEALLDGHLPDPDVVLLRAREVLERRAEGRRLHHAQVHLDALAVPHRGLGRAPLEDLRHLGQPHEGVHHARGIGRGHEDVEVAHGLLAAAHRAGGLDPLDPADARERVRDLLGQGQRASQRHARLPSPHQRDALEEVLLGLGLDAGQPAELARPRQRLELAEIGDLQAVVEELGGLGADAGDAHQIREPGGHLAAQRLERLDPSRPEILADLAGQIGSDPGDLVEPPLGSQGLDVLGERFQISARRGGRRGCGTGSLP